MASEYDIVKALIYDLKDSPTKPAALSSYSVLRAVDRDATFPQIVVERDGGSGSVFFQDRPIIRFRVLVERGSSAQIEVAYQAIRSRYRTRAGYNIGNTGNVIHVLQCEATDSLDIELDDDIAGWIGEFSISFLIVAS